MTAGAWVGIDLGTQSVRVAVYADDGRILGEAAEPLKSVRSPGRHEQDPAVWLAAVHLALGRAIAAAGPAGIGAIAVSGTSGTVVPVDERGRPLGPATMYDDARGAPALERVEAAGARLWSQLGYRMQASWALPRLVAMLAEGGIPRGAFIAHQPDIVVSWLTGSRSATDTSHALKTGVDLRSATWPTGILDSLGVDADRLPRPVLPGTVIGELSAEVSEATGLPRGCVVVAGMTDGCAAQIAAGALGVGDWNSVLGTTLVVKGAATDLRTDPSGAVYSHRAPFGAGWWPGGASSTGAGALTHWLPGEDLAALAPAASTIVPTEPSYPLTGRGERFPFVAAAAEGFLATAEDDSPAARFAAIAHGVAFLERLSYDLLARLGHDVSGRLYATGGGARNPWWTALRAGVLGRDIHVPAVQEGTLGMAVLARAGVTGTPLADVADAMLGPATVVETHGTSPALADLYGRFTMELGRRGWLGEVLDSSVATDGGR